MTNPKLRFKQNNGTGFADWRAVNLSSVAERITRKNVGNESNNPLTISSAKGLVNQLEYFTKKIASSDMSNYFLLRQGEFAYNKSYSVGFDYGSIKRLDKYDSGVLSSLYICFALKTENSDFMTHYFNSLRWYGEMGKICGEGARNHGLLNVSAKDFFEIRITIPSVSEQQKIADFFSVLDEKIALAERKLTALQTLKTGLMQKIFSQEIRFKREDGSNFPDWTEVKMSTMFNSIRNGFVGTIASFYTTKETGVRYLQGTNIHDGVISDDVEYYVTQEFNQAHRKNILKEDDILMVQSGHVGDCAVVGRYAGSNCHALIVMSNANSQKYSSDFVCYYFHSSKGRKNISLLEKGNTVKHVLASDVAKLQMLLPTIEEQKKVVSVLRQMDAKQALARQELNSLILQKQAFLQQMFV